MFQQLINTIKSLVDRPVETRAIRFANNQIFNFLEMGNGRGIRSITIRNQGNYNLVLKDVNEIVRPGEYFVTSHKRHCNKQFEVEFGEVDPTAVNPIKDAIFRYDVDVNY